MRRRLYKLVVFLGLASANKSRKVPMKRWRYFGVLLVGLALSACENSSAPHGVSLNDAIVTRNGDAVKAHLAAGTDVNVADANGITPLIAAVTSGQRDVVQLLLSAGADINAHGPEKRTALIYAIQAEQPEMALFLLEQKGIDPEAREAHGSTPLVEAVVFDQLKVAEVLLEKGADINARGPVGRTAIHAVGPQLDAELFRWLLQRGANPDARDDDSATPLHHAAFSTTPADFAEGRDARSALYLLLESTSDMNAPTNAGQTPLHIAALWANPWLIKALLDTGADPLALDQTGHSPVCYSAGGEDARHRTPAEALAIIAVFRDHGFTDESVIDKRGTTLKTFQGRLQDQP